MNKEWFFTGRNYDLGYFIFGMSETFDIFIAEKIDPTHHYDLHSQNKWCLSETEDPFIITSPSYHHIHNKSDVSVLSELFNLTGYKCMSIQEFFSRSVRTTTTLLDIPILITNQMLEYVAKNNTDDFESYRLRNLFVKVGLDGLIYFNKMILYPLLFSRGMAQLKGERVIGIPTNSEWKFLNGKELFKPYKSINGIENKDWNSFMVVELEPDQDAKYFNIIFPDLTYTTFKIPYTRYVDSRSTRLLSHGPVFTDNKHIPAPQEELKYSRVCGHHVYDWFGV